MTVTLAQPDRRNVQSPRTWRALAALGAGLPDGVEVVVLDALGMSFSAGLDRRLLAAEETGGEPSLARLALLDDVELDAEIAEYQQAFTWWHRADVVSVAVVQGHAVGAGCQLALGCDLRVASTEAAFALAEVRLGLVPDLGGTRRLVDLVGPSRALDLAVSGRTISAHEAFRIGLVDRLVEPESLASTAQSVVGELLAADRQARMAAKRLVTTAASRSVDEQLAAERAAQLPLVRRLLGRSPQA
jgi:enoyl-CoA hydratase/carnithine racemase